MKLKKIILIGTLSLATVATTALAAVASQVVASDNGSVAANAQHQHKDGSAFSTEIAKIIGIDQVMLKSQLKSGKTLAQIASEKGIAANNLVQKIKAMMDANIDKAVQSGKLTADKAATIKAKTAQKANSMVNSKWQGHEGREGKFGVEKQISAILGIDANTLKTELKSGKSLAEIAQAKGRSSSNLVVKIQSAANASIDQAVKSGKLSSDQAAKIKNNLTAAKTEQMVNRTHKAEVGNDND